MTILTIGASASSALVITDNPKCLDFVYKPGKSLEYLINKSFVFRKIIYNQYASKQCGHLHLLLVFNYFVLGVYDMRQCFGVVFII